MKGHSTVTWREKSRGKKRGRKAVLSHPQARREGNGKLLLTHFIWQLVSCLWISLTRCQATGAKFRRPHSCCIQRKEAARQKGPTWLVLYGPLLRPGAPVPLTGASHDDSHDRYHPEHVYLFSRDGIRAVIYNYFFYRVLICQSYCSENASCTFPEHKVTSSNVLSDWSRNPKIFSWCDGEQFLILS